MTTQLESVPSEQRIIKYGISWQQFKAIQASFEDIPGVRLSFIDGTLEIITIHEPHEVISTILGVLLALYFAEVGINVYGTGSVTLEAQEKGASIEPDLSYYIGESEGKEYPDLAIEVIFSSGSNKKLIKYQRFQVREVWLWDQENISVYRLREQAYEQISQSEFFPNLNLTSLVRCSLIHLQEKNMTKAMAEFSNQIRS